MKPASTALQTLLNSKVLFDVADLYKFVLVDGTTILWTTYDTNLLGYSAGVPISRSGLKLERGTIVGSMTITIGVGDGGVLLNGIRLPLATLRGAFDGAKVEVDRLYMGSPGDTSAGVLKWFYGYVSEPAPSSTELVLTVKSSLEKLNTLRYPRRLTEAQCPYALYDARCGLSRTTYQQLDTVNGSVPSGATAVPLLTESGAPHATDFWKLGTIRFTSGSASGLVRSIKSSSGGVVQLAVPLPVDVTNGYTVTLLPGCDKTLNTCTTKFSNQNSFGGFPFVPRPESIR